MKWQIVFTLGILAGWILRGFGQLIENKKIKKNREDKK